MEYSHYSVEPDLKYGKEKILEKALHTLQRFPYLKGDLYKFKGDDKIYVASYEFDVKGWNRGKKASLKVV